MYPFREIEEKWQKRWREARIYDAPDIPHRPKYYVLEMFPYPSGDLHMGHLKNYVIGDVVARIFLRNGYDVLHPMGWDAFGLPAENAAIDRGVDPKKWTYGNIETYRNTLQRLGISYDWRREIATCAPDYYRWTQWLFLFLYHRGLAYRASGLVNWCPHCKTVLANEQVVDGKCERCKTPVVRKELEQWYFKITAYAQRLLDDLKKLEGKWPEQVIKQQINWIGRSEGTEVHFLVDEWNERLPAFTTRIDTLFGVTFVTIAPEHPFVKKYLDRFPNREAVRQYVEAALKKSDIERTALDRPKTGVDTGITVRHPLTGEQVPLWVGDYVLATYGTGVVMGVPAHDQRDFEFAKKFELPIRVVIRPVDGETPDPDEMEAAFEDYGVMVNSGEFSGLDSKTGIQKVGEKLQALGLGGPTVTYRLRDWLISRQRYWGAPIPMIHCERCGVVPVPEEELPVLLPENIQSYLPEGRSPLEDVPEFMNTTCPSCGGPARRDPDTMDTFVDSSWYFLRFIDPKNEEKPFDPEKANAWMPVDQYIGGAEHATKHLIFARFITKALYDAGLLEVDEPFDRLFTQGLVLKRYWYCPTCHRLVDGEVQEGKHEVCDTPVEERLEMMSKSRGNIVPVGPFVAQNGADVARIAILFAAPAEKDMEWSDAGVEGARRFLQRIWKIYQEHKPSASVKVDPETLGPEEKRLYIRLQQTLKGVMEDSQAFHFNTAIAKLMEFLNDLTDFPAKDSPVFAYALRDFVLMLAPFAPHLAEELWEQMGGEGFVAQIPLPEPDVRYLEEETVVIPVQVNGRVRARLKVPRGLPQEDIVERALANENIQRYVQNKSIRKVIYIPDRLLNLVV